jgi:hypothetical protein
MMAVIVARVFALDVDGEPPLVERHLDDHPEIIKAYERYRPN